MLNAVDYAGPIAVTLSYLGLYYGFQIWSLQVKVRLDKAYKARGEKFDRYFGKDREMLAADRVQLNTLEHMPPFLALLWLNALFVGPGPATIAGAVYIVSRLAYPFVIGKRLGRMIRSRVMLATFTGYAVLVYFFGALVVEVLG